MDENHGSAGTEMPLFKEGQQQPTVNRSFQWIFYLAASFYFGGVFLRSLLVYRGQPEILPVLGIQLLLVVLFFSEPAASNKWPGYFPVYLVLQTGLIFALLGMPGYPDFFASLLMIPSMQAMLRLGIRIWIAWIGFSTLVTVLLLVKTYQNESVALVLIYTLGNVFYGFFARTAQRAQTVQAQNRSIARELHEANQELQAYSTRMEQLTAARERNRLARDLHDSVTQTAFSMTLATQSAALLLERDPVKAGAQLDRLSQLAHNALSEMQLLISELKPEGARSEGLAATVRSYLAGARFPENLCIGLQVQGEQPLGLAEEQALFHIIQEALNNIVKHAQTIEAQVRMHLTEPMWIEVEDRGQGFNVQQAQNSGRVGLFSMRERAAEVGWDLQIKTSPGYGTCVRVEKLPEEVRQE
jgi:signal transduction histidine kinase